MTPQRHGSPQGHGGGRFFRGRASDRHACGESPRRKAPKVLFKARDLRGRATPGGSWPVRMRWGFSKAPCARIGDEKVFEARRAGALSPRTGENLDSVTLGRYTHSLGDSSSSKVYRSQSRCSRDDVFWKNFQNTREEPKHSRGCAHAACQLLQKSIDDIAHERSPASRSEECSRWPKAGDRAGRTDVGRRIMVAKP